MLLPLLLLASLPSLSLPFSIPSPLPAPLPARTSLFSSTMDPPARVAPSAGWTPEWENRPGLAPEEFLNSDPAKPDIGASIYECPLTLWDAENIDLAEGQASAKELPHCPAEIKASAEDNAAGRKYFEANGAEIRARLREHGAVWLRGFSLPQSVAGFREVHEALGLQPCLDPLHSSGLRKFASERDALYEEVNKPALRGHYIGLHSESTAKRTAAYAAFVCFQRATESGGRFLVADGAKILAEMDPALLRKLYERKVRISVSNLDVPPELPRALKDGFKKVVAKAVAPK